MGLGSREAPDWAKVHIEFIYIYIYIVCACVHVFKMCVCVCVCVFRRVCLAQSLVGCEAA